MGPPDAVGVFENATVERAGESRLRLEDTRWLWDVLQDPVPGGANGGAFHFHPALQCPELDTPMGEPPDSTLNQAILKPQGKSMFTHRSPAAVTADDARTQHNESEAVEALRRCQGASVWFRGFNAAELSQLVRATPEENGMEAVPTHAALVPASETIRSQRHQHPHADHRAAAVMSSAGGVHHLPHPRARGGGGSRRGAVHVPWPAGLGRGVRPAWYPRRLPARCPPSVVPSQAPSVVPSQAPSVVPSLAPSVVLSQAPSVSPSMAPSASPAQAPSASPSQVDILDHKGAVQDVADQGALIGEAAFFFGGKWLTSVHPAHLSPRVMCRVTPLAQGLVGGLCSRCSGERESAPPVCAYIHT